MSRKVGCLIPNDPVLSKLGYFQNYLLALYPTRVCHRVGMAEHAIRVRVPAEHTKGFDTYRNMAGFQIHLSTKDGSL